MNGCCDWRLGRSRFRVGRRICGEPAVVERGGQSYCAKHNPDTRARYAANKAAKQENEKTHVKS